MASDVELAAALERSLAPPVRVLVRQPWPYPSSAPIEWLDVETGSGERLPIVWKDLTPSAPRSDAAADPARELRAYDLLTIAQLGAPQCYAALADRDRTWLFLEAVDGRRLDEVGEPDIWCAVARWLAHARTALTSWAHGLDFPPSWRRPDLGAATARASGARRGRLTALAAPLAIAWAHAAAGPLSVVHGELYPANVVVADDRVCVLDWETIARGPALLDLAALTEGRWEEPGEPIAEAYRTALPDARPREELLANLDACRLLVAAGWLARSSPHEQARDWLADAELIAARMST